MLLRSWKFIVQCNIVVLLFWMILTVQAEAQAVTLNGLELGVDDQTGSLIYLSYPATGRILESAPDSAGLLDLAYPVDSFVPMRLASRFSKARVVKGINGVTIIWDALGPSRSNFPLPSGKVSAQVQIQSASDGRSVILTCRIENQSSAAVPQILFPDLHGLKPFGGIERTRLRFPTAVLQPFQEPIKAPHSTPFYARLGWKEYPPGGYMFAENSLRWLDLGSLKGGLSVFQKKWGTNDRPSVLTYRSEVDPMSLRVAWEHQKTIEPGQIWESGEFWLTPHAGGWAKGIEVYRDYVTKANPPRPLPSHVRDGVGFQTIWMLQEPERDPAKAAFRFKDLPRVAQDAREHGIDELVPWSWCSYFRLPIPIREELGTIQEFVDGVQQARKMGVNVAPFVSVHIVLNRYVSRYGVAPGKDDWTYHPELIPIFRSYYTKTLMGASIGDDNKIWQQDVLAALTEWIDRGIYSFSWDQFIYKTAEEQKPGLIRVTEKVRNLARAKDPESTFSGESATNLELDSPVIDYTWIWGGCGDGYSDAGPLVNVLRSPRPNCNVEDSPLVVKQGFSDGLYLNIMPRKRDGANGTALISEQPALSAAVKEVARFRKQFLSFFVEGILIGESVLSEPTSAFVRGHQLGKRLLVILLNDQNKPQQVILRSDLDLWLPSARHYRVKYYDSRGKLVETVDKEGAQWSGITRLLEPLELAFFEIQTL